MTDLGISLLLAGWAFTHGKAAQPGPLSMSQAILIAEQNAFAVRLQKSSVEKDRQALLLALANMNPTIGVTGTFTRFGNEVAVQIAPNTPPVVVSPISTQIGQATLVWPIDISGNLHRLAGASDATLRSAKQSLEASFNDARLSARTAYLSVLRSKALVVVAVETLKDAQDRLDQANLEFAQQRIAKIDVDRLDAQVAQDNSDLITAQNNLVLSNYAFNQALARPIETPVDLLELNDLPPVPNNAGAISDKAQQTRPEAVAIVDQIRALALIRRATESGLDPSLSFSMGYQQNLDPNGFGSASSTTSVAMTLSIPVFDSGQTRARVNEARQDEVQAKIQLQQEQLSISQEVRNAFANLISAQARITNAERQVKLAEEVFRLAKVRQDAGEGTYVEVVDAETALETARNGQVSAKYDYLLAYSQLQRAVGNDKVDALALARKAASAGSGGLN